MKNLRSALLALAIVALTSLQATPATANSYAGNTSAQMATVTCQQVIAYLQSTGHAVLTTPFTEDGGFTWRCVTAKRGLHYNTTVFTDGDCIVNHTDELID